MRRILSFLGKAALFVVVAGLLLSVVVPRFLDRIYYRGPADGHYDGERFFNPDGGDEGQRPPGGGGRLAFFWRNLTDDRPAWPEQVPVRQARAAELLQAAAADGTRTAASPAEVAAAPMRATWIGHASVLVQTPAVNILTDPVWRRNTGPGPLGPARVAEPGIAFETLPRIDLVLVSHNHYDHLDLTTLKRLWERDRPTIVTSLGNDSVIGQVGAKATALDWRQRLTVRPGVEVAVTRNHHWGSRWFADRNRALWSSFVVRLPSGGNLFFAGDTGFGDGRWPAEAAALGPIRLALIPIGAFRFAPGQMGAGSHIGPLDAVEVYRRLGAAHGLAIHWGTFRLSYEAYDTPPRLLAAGMACTRQTGFTGVPIGVAQEVPVYRAPAAVPTMTREQRLACLNTPAVRAMR